MNPYKIEWLTVPAPDLPAAKHFYETVFGFEVSEHSDRFWVFRSASLSGGFDADLKISNEEIGFSNTVPEIACSLQAIVESGGTILRHGYSLGQGAGYCAQFKDPNGNVLELYSEALGENGS